MMNLNVDFSRNSIPATSLSSKEVTDSEEITLKKVLYAAATGIGGVLVFAAVAAGGGSLLKIAGSQLNFQSTSTLAHLASKVGGIVTKAGDALFLAGKYAFLSIAVPAYVVLWVAPQWVIQKGLPACIRLTHHYVLLPLSKGIVQAIQFVASKLLKLAQWVYNSALKPLGDLLDSATEWCINRVAIPLFNGISRVIDAMGHRMEHLAQIIYTYTLKPFGRAMAQMAKWIWKSVALPICHSVAQAFDKTVQAIYTYVLKPLAHTLVGSAQWIWKSVALPICNGIVQAFNKTAQAIHTYVLKPLVDTLVGSAQWIWKSVALPICNGVAQAFNATAQAVYSYVLAPAGRIVSEVSKWLWKSAVLPLYKGVVLATNFVCSKLAIVAQAVNRAAIEPLKRLTTRAFLITCEYTYKGFKAAQASIYDSYYWISQKFAGNSAIYQPRAV